ncbi:electron transport complex subunit RsxB [Rhodoferax lacus]|uniref:Electron transport complex subunit RsxB n=1 Tax=Rhodoferax lacus TaxID=2184758 RepID=A0A3E1RHU7_9BURK|nr:electron transport complex subunit RsxB [Rhodoferax lacus]RFO98975.1 electron transport complex subunit RsxB [Rhodoferax lacus]
MTSPLIGRIHDALPQTQCKRCGYPDCLGYAQAISIGAADINQCPPGGAEGVLRLAAITGHAVKPIDPDFGAEGPRTVAFVDEDWCIGCTLCIAACPVDAILGANKRMHTVIEAHCTGCELCLPVCPVDCILLENVSGEATGWQAWSAPEAQQARDRYEARSARLAREVQEQEQRLLAKATLKVSDIAEHSQHTDPAVLAKKRSIIEAVLERARAKRKPAD